MGKFRGLDKDEGWIKRRFAKIEKQMREDRASKRLASSTIGAGGVTVKDGGRVTGRYPSGRVAFEFGQISADAAGLPGDETYGFRVVKDQDYDGVSTNSIFDIFSSPAAGLVARFFGVDFFSATGTLGAILSGGGKTVVVTASGTTIDHTTTAAAANAVLDAGTGLLSRSTSSLRYKQDVEDADVDPAAVLDMQPRTWRDKAEVEEDPDTESRYVGFIAEELHDLGLGQFVVYDTDGDPEAISYDRLTVALLAVLKDQEKRIAALEADDA